MLFDDDAREGRGDLRWQRHDEAVDDANPDQQLDDADGGQYRQRTDDARAIARCGARFIAPPKTPAASSP